MGFLLHSSTEAKLLEKVQHEFLSVYATQLLEKDDSQCHALVRDDKVEDLSRMSGLLFYLSKNKKKRFRLLFKIPQGIEPVSSILSSMSLLK